MLTPGVRCIAGTSLATWPGLPLKIITIDLTFYLAFIYTLEVDKVLPHFSSDDLWPSVYTPYLRILPTKTLMSSDIMVLWVRNPGTV